jgi:phosphate transport system substrate-binding protein
MRNYLSAVMIKSLYSQHILTLALSAIALLGLPSCTTTSSAPKTETTTTVATATQTSIKVSGSSAVSMMLTLLETDFNSTSKNLKITQLEPGQAANAIKGIKQNLVDLAVIGREIKPEENDGTIESRAIAQDALLVATHPTVTEVKNLTTENLKSIYSGTVTNWKQLGGPDAKIVLLDRPEDESAKHLLRKHYLGADLQNSPEAVPLRHEHDLIQAIQGTPYSIGFFSLTYAISNNLPVNHLSLNGVKPTNENVKADKYPMARTISIVWRKNPSKATQVLIKYISSPQGINAMEQAGFIPVTQTRKN